MVVVIHQPSAGVFGEFDDLLLLAEDGRPAYFGPADQAVSALSDALQQPAPPKGVAHAEYCLQQVKPAICSFRQWNRPPPPRPLNASPP